MMSTAEGSPGLCHDSDDEILLKWVITVFFLVLGFTTLGAYIKIGIEHAPNYGERYVPTWQRTVPQEQPR